MNNLPIGADDDLQAPWNEEKTFECNVCGKPIQREGLCKSKACFKADQM